MVPILKVKERSHDPRFDERSGAFSKELFMKSFHFIDDMRKNEKLQIHKALKKTRNLEKKRELQSLLQQMVRDISLYPNTNKSILILDFPC